MHFAAPQLCRGVLASVLALIQASDDPQEQSSAVNLLLQFLRACPPQALLAAGAAASGAATRNGGHASSGGGGHGSEGDVLVQLLAAARHLLQPAQQDGSTRLAGPLMAQLLKSFPEQLAAAPPPALLAAASSSNTSSSSGAASSCVALLLHDTAARLASGDCSPLTVAHLLQFVVRLVLLDVHKTVELLAATAVQTPGACLATLGCGCGGLCCGLGCCAVRGAKAGAPHAKAAA